MYRSKFLFWQSALASLVFLLYHGDASFAQSPNGFNKTGRSRPAASNPQRPQNTASANRGNGQSGNRGNQRNHSHSNSRNRGRQFNHHSFYPSRTVTGMGHRYSPGHFRGTYVPLVPYGYANPYGYADPYGYGYGGPIYQDPYLYGNGFNNGGFNNGGFNNGGFGYNNNLGYNPGHQNFNPAYSTYGSNLNSGGVLGSNAIGSSVAAQALERLRNQQQMIPSNQPANDSRDAEILRLQIELERAKQALANQDPSAQQQAQITMKPPVQASPQPSNQEVVDQLGLAAIIETNQLAAASHLKAERAFRAGEYGQAARFSGLAKSLDESNGKLMLFASQAHFANGEYREAATALTEASSLLKPDEIGWVIENFKLFYGQNDFVNQVRSLSAHLKQSPNDARAWLLRGYQYGALGYPAAAKKDLNRAKELGANSQVADMLLARFAPEADGE